MLRLRLLAALASLAVAGTAVAGGGNTGSGGVLISPSSLSGPDLGKLVQGATVSVWSVTPTGSVTETSGTAVRLTSGPSDPPLITVLCQGNCTKSGSTITVTFAPAGGSGRASVISFTPGTVTPSGLSLTSTSGANTSNLVMTFKTTGSSKQTSASFPLGMGVKIAATPTTYGVNTYSYTVTAAVN